jgi:hypothetical protein
MLILNNFLVLCIWYEEKQEGVGVEIDVAELIALEGKEVATYGEIFLRNPPFLRVVHIK